MAVEVTDIDEDVATLMIIKSKVRIFAQGFIKEFHLGGEAHGSQHFVL